MLDKNSFLATNLGNLREDKKCFGFNLLSFPKYFCFLSTFAMVGHCVNIYSK